MPAIASTMASTRARAPRASGSSRTATRRRSSQWVGTPSGPRTRGDDTSVLLTGAGSLAETLPTIRASTPLFRRVSRIAGLLGGRGAGGRGGRRRSIEIEDARAAHVALGLVAGDLSDLADDLRHALGFVEDDLPRAVARRLRLEAALEQLGVGHDARQRLGSRRCRGPR